MKFIDFFKMLENLKYDNDTDFDVVVVNGDGSIKFLQIEDVCNNASCAGHNEIGIVLMDKQD